VQLKGPVFQNDGAPAISALVEAFTDVEESPVASTTTDGNGIWEFTDLPNEPVTIKITFGDAVRWIVPNTIWQIEDLVDANGQSAVLTPGAITTTYLADSAVATSKIANNAVTIAKLGSGTPRTNSGSYTGDGSTSRSISVGFTPRLVIVTRDDASEAMALLISSTSYSMRILQSTGNNITRTGSATLQSGGFRVGGSVGNTSGVTHHWAAFG
jgi:hypothetical protein